jgi:hypothetical protein
MSATCAALWILTLAKKLTQDLKKIPEQLHSMLENVDQIKVFRYPVRQL